MASSGPPRQDPFTGATWLVWACAQAALGTSGAIVALAAVDALTLALQRRAGSVGNVPIGRLAATATTSLGNVTRSSQTSGYYALIRWYQFVQVTLRRARLCACVFSDQTGSVSVGNQLRHLGGAQCSHFVVGIPWRGIRDGERDRISMQDLSSPINQFNLAFCHNSSFK
jgi:hypothetical protein